MRRDAVITVLLVLAGIILAFVLFGAGAFWKSRNTRRSSSQGFHIDRTQAGAADMLELDRRRLTFQSHIGVGLLVKAGEIGLSLRRDAV